MDNADYNSLYVFIEVWESLVSAVLLDLWFSVNLVYFFIFSRVWRYL